MVVINHRNIPWGPRCLQPRDEDDTEEPEVAQLEVDEIIEEENEVTMNIVRDNIANALISWR
jgi:hypothetical protein